MPIAKPCLEAALGYLQLGWSVIALCPHSHDDVSPNHEATCKKRGKTPLWPWKAYQDRLARTTEVKLWWNRNPQCNVGIAMGPVSNLIGIDIDNEAGEQLLQQWSGGDIPATLEFTTPSGGRRLLFRWPTTNVPIKSFKFNDGEALRILSKGSQTVAPPSRLPTGHPYAWIAGRGPQDIQPAECPAWLLAQLQTPQEDDQGQVPAVVVSSASEVSPYTRARAYLLKCEPCNPLPDHPMDASTHHLKIATAMMVGFALPLESAITLIREWDQAGNPSPWPESEIRRKCEQAVAHSTKPLGYLLHQPDPKPIKMNTNTNNAASAATQAVARRFKDIEAKAMEWLWPGWLPLGKLAVLDGDPGLGKSTMLLDLAARISNHALMPDGKIGIAGSVIVMSAEDAADDTIRPRLEAAGANLDRVIDLSHVIVNGEERPIEVPKDLPLIASKIREHEARLLIVDPLMAFLCGADANKDQEIRRVLYKFSKISEKYRCATIAMRHLNKSGTGKAIYRGNSSIGVIGHARTGLIVAVDPDDDHKRVLAASKVNNGPKPQALRYILDPVGDVCRVGWCGTSPYSADELVSQRSDEEKANQQEVQSKVQQAIVILELLLEENNGRIEVQPARAELRAADISMTTAKRAVNQLGLIVSYANQPDGTRRYYWTRQEASI